MLDLDTRRGIVIEAEYFTLELIREDSDCITREGIDCRLEELGEMYKGPYLYDKADIKQLILIKKRQVNEYRQDIVELNNFHFGGVNHTVDSCCYREELEMLRDTVSRLEGEVMYLETYIQIY